MAFIKTQKIVRDDDGNILSGSAAIVDTVYVQTGTANHSKQEIREKLGKVISLSEDKKSGIFLSPTRGLVSYDAKTDTFSEIEKEEVKKVDANMFSEAKIHTVFGDTYLLLSFLKKCGLLKILRNVFPKDEDYERVLCHVLHGVLRDGSRITCDCFIQKSFASYLASDIPLTTLKSDTYFFHMLGNDEVKISFFKNFVTYMQKSNPDFGKGCYVDSTPLPNDIDDNPFNALCCHGVGSSEVMTRLILVLDRESGLPVWYDIIPGNVMDLNTVMNITNDVADTLGIEIDSLVLDAGYVSKELIHTFHIGTDKTIIGRMPAKKGYPYKTLYWETKDIVNKGKYAFARKNHTYFGIRKEIKLFNEDMYAYVYVDKFNALKRFNDYLVNNEDEYEDLKAKDKDWMTVKFGYFVLVSNIEAAPKELLSEYFGRTDIETVFKTSKEYLDLLPLSKWTDVTVRGKILHDIIDTIVVLNLRKQMKECGYSITDLFGRCQSLMCFKNNAGKVTVETPNKQVKGYYKIFDIDIPSHLKMEEYDRGIMNIG